MSPSDPRRCLITGGSSGIGAAVAGLLHDRGWAVTSLSRRGSAPAGVRAVAGDAADGGAIGEAIAAAVGDAAGLDGLVCAAGQPPSGPWDDRGHWDEIIRVDLSAAYEALRLAWPRLTAAGGAAVLIGSIVGAAEGSTRSPAYAAAKAGLEGLARSFALIGARHGVRVNVVAPGAIDTPFDDALFPPDARPDVPLGRMGTADEAAGVVAFLLGPEATYVNGAVWRVDGGRTVVSPATAAGRAAPGDHPES